MVPGSQGTLQASLAYIMEMRHEIHNQKEQKKIEKTRSCNSNMNLSGYTDLRRQCQDVKEMCFSGIMVVPAGGLQAVPWRDNPDLGGRDELQERRVPISCI